MTVSMGEVKQFKGLVQAAPLQETTVFTIGPLNLSIVSSLIRGMPYSCHTPTD